MSGQGQNPSGHGGIHIGGNVTSSNIQAGSGTVYGGMHVSAAPSAAAAIEAALAALRELRSELDRHGVATMEAEQARTAASIIEREITGSHPSHPTLRAALAKLQNLVLAVGPIAGAVNKIAAAFAAIGV